MPAGSGDATPGAVTGKITAIQATADTCDQNAANLKLLRGRSIVYVDGRVAARRSFRW